MRLLIQALLLASATSYVVALPIDNRGADNACYYKRNLNTYGRRAPGGAEIACAAPSTHNIERGLGVAADSSCYYRRDSNGKTVGYRRGVNGTEVHCGAERRHEMMADNACYYKRDENGLMAGYKRDVTGAEILCK